jgi:hypothetical protein
MIRRYGPEDEQRVLVAGHVRDWARAGLLTAEQARTIERRLQTGLRRTNVFLRGALALFTAVVVAAATALVFVSFGITRAAPTALTLAAGAIACIACAEYLIGAFHVHRHGVEEALVGGAIVLVSLATRRMADAATMPEQDAIVSGVAAVAAAAAYGRYGFVYCAVAAMACAAGIPLALDWSSTLRLSIAAAICAATVAVARAARRDEDEVRAGDWTLVQAAAVAGMYLFINVRLFDVVGPAGARSVAAWFYWTTYVLTWAIPAAGLLAGLRDRDRPLLTVSLALAFATLATNKPYLGLARESWDPILFGALFVAVATAVRRWLARGPNGERSGFTAQKILERDRDWLRSVATASVAWPPHDITARPSEPPPSQFEGGRSGGGGGGATY